MASGSNAPNILVEATYSFAEKLDHLMGDNEIDIVTPVPQNTSTQQFLGIMGTLQNTYPKSTPWMFEINGRHFIVMYHRKETTE